METSERETSVQELLISLFPLEFPSVQEEGSRISWSVKTFYWGQDCDHLYQLDIAQLMEWTMATTTFIHTSVAPWV